MIQELKSTCPLCGSVIKTKLFVMPESPRGNYQEPWYCSTCDLMFAQPDELIRWCRNNYAKMAQFQKWTGIVIKWVKQFELFSNRNKGVKIGEPTN